MVTMDTLMRVMFERNASDLHLTTGVPPMLRIDGEIVATDFEKLKPDNTATLIASIKNRLWPMGDDTVFIACVDRGTLKRLRLRLARLSEG